MVENTAFQILFDWVIAMKGTHKLTLSNIKRHTQHNICTDCLRPFCLDVSNCWLLSLKEQGSDRNMLQLNGQVPM